MTEKTVKHIRTASGIALSLSLLVSGACLMLQCVSIYRSGDHPYSREVVAAHFSPIAVPIYLTLVLIVLTALLAVFLPKGTGKRQPVKQTALLLRRLREKKDLSQCESSLRTAIEAQERSRALHRRICGLLCGVCAIVFLCYALNGNNFHRSEINASMRRAMSVLLPCLLPPFAYAVFTAFHAEKSMQKEIALLQQVKATCSVPAPAPKRSGWRYFRCAVLIVGAILLLTGFFTGGTADVLTKAINICTECVGLG